MKKLKLMQFSFSGTAVIATVLFVCVPFDIVPVLYAVLYVLFVLAPQVAAIVFQLRSIKHDIIEYKKALDDYRGYNKGKEKRGVRRPLIFADALHTITELKSMGIHPNRAGPSGAFA